MGTERKTPDRFMKGILDIIRGSFDVLGDTEVEHANMVRKSKTGPGFPYYRFNQVDALADMDFDEWKGKHGSKTLSKMEKVFHEWAIQPEQQDSFRKRARELVRRRRLRCRDTSKWESYATASYFVCDRRCGQTFDKKWFSREEFVQHLTSAHDMERPVNDTTLKEFRVQWKYPDN